MNTIRTALIAATTLVGALSAAILTALASDGSVAELKAYPETLKGYERIVMHLEAKNNEEDYKVEILPGKLAEIDCNQHFLIAKTSAREVKGWGFTYYVVKSDGKMGSTLKGCTTQPKRTVFVTAESTLVGYNSRLPIVVFVPKGLTAQYRLWSAAGVKAMPDPEAKAAYVTPVAEAGQTVVITQKKGLKVTKRRDKNGNTINFTQSD